jgi:tRNA 2-thiouridine synthesizing protein A
MDGCRFSLNDSGEMMADLLLDTTGLNCPLPILKAKKAMVQIPIDGTLEVLATDPAADPDFRAFCRSTGHELVESGQNGAVYRFVIRRKK